MSGSKSMVKFHNHRGINIIFTEDQQVAHRKNSFAHAITFSARPLRPMEIFLVEIEKNESGWSGHMRIGLTMHNPDKRFQLPQYALPDLANQGQTWVYAVTKSNNKVVDTEHGEITLKHSLLGTGDSVRTYNGIIERTLLRPPPRVLSMKRLKRKLQQQRQEYTQAQLALAQVEKREHMVTGMSAEGAVGGLGVSAAPSTSRGMASAASSFGGGGLPAAQPGPSTSAAVPRSGPSAHQRVESRPEPPRYHQPELTGYSSYGGPETRIVPQIREQQRQLEAAVLTTQPELLGDDDEEINDEEVLPTDEGSRIGIVYVVKGDKAEMHFIINGEDQGPCTRDIPYKDGPLYALVDVYGTTKQIRLIPLISGKCCLHYFH